MRQARETSTAQASPPGKTLSKLSPHEIVALLDQPNSWQRRELWPFLGERTDPGLVSAFRQRLESSDEVKSVEALWAIFLCGGLDDAFASRALEHPAQSVRDWTIRLLADKKAVSGSQATDFVRLAKTDPSGVVRSQLACSAKRLSGKQGLPIIAELMRRDEDAHDPHIPLLIWWAIENKVLSDREAVLSMLDAPNTWRRPIVRDVLVERLARRYLAVGDDGGYAACAWLLNHAPTPADTERIVAGMEIQLAGRRFDHVPAELAAPLRKIAESPSPSPAALCLALRLGSNEAWPKLTALAKNHSAPLVDRLKAIRALSEAGPSKTVDELLPLVEKGQPDAIADAVLLTAPRALQ